ncbi:hypothetical protein ABFY59_19145 [Priestia aryabhattai]|uniref:hypothetical protein n=1 Tax=Priestia aryabhattai TaxID=412384 RepID=UPI003D2A1AD0
MSSASRFKMRIYSPQWGHKDLYQFKKTKPLFYKALLTESISYPNYLKTYISSAWENVNTLNKEQVQNIFDELSKWISASEHDIN